MTSRVMKCSERPIPAVLCGIGRPRYDRRAMVLPLSVDRAPAVDPPVLVVSAAERPGSEVLVSAEIWVAGRQYDNMMSSICGLKCMTVMMLTMASQSSEPNVSSAR